MIATFAVLGGSGGTADVIYDWFVAIVPHAVWIVHLVVNVFAAGHVVMKKRDVRAAIGWVGIIWLVPFLGAMLYLTFGVNRIRRKAALLRKARPRLDGQAKTQPDPPDCTSRPDQIERAVGGRNELVSLAKLVGEITGRSLLAGNRVQPLDGGDAAYPAMLSAIDDAQRSVSLSTYIFDNDRAGELFQTALSRAVARGVEVRVLIDGVGARYSFPSIVGSLRKAGLTTALFMRTIYPGWLRYANLRSHRKLLVVDGRLGFTGGMNIREGCLLKLSPRHPVADLHFQMEGPVVADLQEAFMEDWYFTTAERLEGDCWFPRLEGAGETLARGVMDGPDEDYDKVRMTLLGALACAQDSVQIMTPYFLPDQALTTALNVTALRGVAVDIVLPSECNMTTVGWAMMGSLPEVLERNCRVWLSPPPFHHTKLMVVDGAWSFVGSANWDPRSLSLNFEFNVECYDEPLAAQLAELARSQIGRSRQVTLGDVKRRIFFLRLRDNLARLASPYL